jgi:hypothetical protein
MDGIISKPAGKVLLSPEMPFESRTDERGRLKLLL